MRTLQGLVLGLVLIIAAACGSAEGNTGTAEAGETATTTAVPATTEATVESTEEPTTTTTVVETVEEPETTVPDDPPRRQQQAMRNLLIPGDPEIENTLATLEATDDEVEIVVSTIGLNPGNPISVWVAGLKVQECKVAFPAFDPCQPFVLLDQPATNRPDLGNMRYLGGGIPDADGAISIANTLTNEGLPSETGPGEVGWWYETEFSNFRDLIYHVIIRDHGPPIDGIVEDMWTTYRGGCTDESLDPGAPESAINDGPVGPNTCQDIQATPFVPEPETTD